MNEVKKDMEFEGEVIRTSGREIIIGLGGEPLLGQNTKEFIDSRKRRSDDLFEEVDRRCKTLLECMEALERCPEDRRVIVCPMVNEVWAIRETMGRIKKELRR